MMMRYAVHPNPLSGCSRVDSDGTKYCVKHMHPVKRPTVSHAHPRRTLRSPNSPPMAQSLITQRKKGISAPMDHDDPKPQDRVGIGRVVEPLDAHQPHGDVQRGEEERPVDRALRVGVEHPAADAKADDEGDQIGRVHVFVRIIEALVPQRPWALTSATVQPTSRACRAQVERALGIRGLPVDGRRDPAGPQGERRARDLDASRRPQRISDRRPSARPPANRLIRSPKNSQRHVGLNRVDLARGPGPRR